MSENNYAGDLLKRGIDDINSSLDESMQYIYSDDMVFIGKNSVLDSMDRVCFIEFIESALEDEKDMEIRLLDDPWFSEISSCTMKQLEDYINTHLKGTGES